MMPPGHNQSLLIDIATVLSEMADDMEDLGASLCSNPTVVSSNLQQLQSIDRVAQTARQIANVLQADCATQGVSGIRLDSLRQRLQDSLPC